MNPRPIKKKFPIAAFSSQTPPPPPLRFLLSPQRRVARRATDRWTEPHGMAAVAGWSTRCWRAQGGWRRLESRRWRGQDGGVPRGCPVWLRGRAGGGVAHDGKETRMQARTPTCSMDSTPIPHGVAAVRYVMEGHVLLSI